MCKFDRIRLFCALDKKLTTASHSAARSVFPGKYFWFSSLNGLFHILTIKRPSNSAMGKTIKPEYTHNQSDRKRVDIASTFLRVSGTEAPSVGRVSNTVKGKILFFRKVFALLSSTSSFALRILFAASFTESSFPLVYAHWSSSKSIRMQLHFYFIRPFSLSYAPNSMPLFDWKSISRFPAFSPNRSFVQLTRVFTFSQLNPQNMHSADFSYSSGQKFYWPLCPIERCWPNHLTTCESQNLGESFVQTLALCPLKVRSSFGHWASKKRPTLRPTLSPIDRTNWRQQTAVFCSECSATHTHTGTNCHQWLIFVREFVNREQGKRETKIAVHNPTTSGMETEKTNLYLSSAVERTQRTHFQCTQHFVSVLTILHLRWHTHANWPSQSMRSDYKVSKIKNVDRPDV